MNIHFSSKTDMWETPRQLFDDLDVEHHFTLDVCATENNAKCEKFFTKEQDGLSKSWQGHSCWMNPPYGREIGKWVKKAFNESQRNCLVVCLLPARTDTAWWHDYVKQGDITFIRGRIKFGGHKNSAPFPSAIVVFGGDF